MKTLALISIHGMGETQPDYADKLFARLNASLAENSSQLFCTAVYYQDLLHYNEQRVWQALGHRLRWSKLRRFMLFGFADAAALEHRKEQPHSLYHYSQLKIARALYLAKQQLSETGKLVLLAHSLGCHVLSCYLWDAQQAKAGIKPAAGIWRDSAASQRCPTLSMMRCWPAWTSAIRSARPSAANRRWNAGDRRATRFDIAAAP